MTDMLDCSVISLVGSPRRAHVSEHLREHQIPFQFFDAIDGRLLPERFHRHLSFWTQNNITRKRLLPGELGVFASHFSLWQEVADSGRPRVIFEDDIYLTESTAIAFPRLSSLAEEFGFVRLHATVHGTRPVGQRGKLTVSLCMCPKDAALAYALTPEVARRLVDCAAVWAEPVDHFISSTYVHGIEVHVVEPCMAEIREQFDSSIQPGKRTTIPLWLKPFVKPVHFANKHRIGRQLRRQKRMLSRETA